jgi:fructose-bisphosphate aldolase class I
MAAVAMSAGVAFSQGMSLGKSEFAGKLMKQSAATIAPAKFQNAAVSVRAAGYDEELVKTAKKIASPGRGILAMDESNATCGLRLASIGLENTEVNRQAYRQLLVGTPGLGEYVSGAILFEETLYQSTTDGNKMVDVLTEAGIVPGIKVDKGLVPLAGSNNESWCQGLDGLASRTAAYYKQGARFAKWRTVISIPNGPSELAVTEAAWGLARYAAISQVLSVTHVWLWLPTLVWLLFSGTHRSSQTIFRSFLLSSLTLTTTVFCEEKVC